jgi:hypothetical protein
MFDFGFIYFLISMAATTHPVCASLDIPLFAFGGKREIYFPYPLCGKAGERVDKRSDVGVSRYTGTFIFFIILLNYFSLRKYIAQLQFYFVSLNNKSS